MVSDGIRRTHFLSFWIVFVAVLIIGKLFFIQVVNGGAYSEEADRQYATPASQVFDRGSIFFREHGGGLATAATLDSGFIVAITPKEITNPEEYFSKLNTILPIDREDFFKKVAKTEDPYEEIARRATKKIADDIAKENLQGVKIFKEKWRFYPSNETGARVLGFVGYNNDDTLSGRYGIERYYNDVLKRGGSGLYVNFFAEVFSNLGDSILGEEGEGDIVLTIEPEVERMLHGELRGVLKDWSSDLVGGVVMNPKTGEIFAMDVLPGFDPNNVRAIKNTNVLNNPIVESVYEMGSIMKPLVMAAGLDAGVVTALSTYEDKGSVTIDGRKISNYDGKARGVVPMQEVLSQSLNTGMAYVAGRLGRDRVRSYLLGYGLGEDTGIDLPSEISGLVKNLESPRDVEYATASFGQGIAVTPIEMVRALSSLGNGGVLPAPHLIETIDYKTGFSRKPEYDDGRRVISEKTSEEITRMLVNVVDKALLGGTVKIPEYSVAAKTGTAQISKGGGGGYYEDRYLHSFFGYFPAYDPKFIIFLYTVNPKGVNFASHTLTHPFMRLTKFLLNYYEIPPDR